MGISREHTQSFQCGSIDRLMYETHGLHALVYLSRWPWYGDNQKLSVALRMALETLLLMILQFWWVFSG